MSRRNRILATTLAFTLSGGLTFSAAAKDNPRGTDQRPEVTHPQSPPDSSAGAITPKPISPEVKKGLEFLVRTQLPSGAWGQGDEAPTMGGSMDALRATPNVADTSMATLALLRAGSTPTEGPHTKAVQKALDYIVESIEKSDDKSLYVTDVRSTRTQMKLGPYVDTFASSLLLGEVRGKMGGEEKNARLERAFAKVLRKIEMNQKGDGTWDKGGWAPALSQALGTRAYNKAAKSGVKTDDSVRARAEEYASKQYDTKTGRFGGEGSAGVDLYSGAANVSSLEATVEANEAAEKDVQAVIADPKAPEPAKKAARQRLEQFKATKAQADASRQAIEKRMNDPAFVSGFGSNGGEEFLSYMLIGETMVQKAGKEFADWDRAMTKNINRVQNADGSWTGHHCITGRTFVTAAALLVLTVDRAQGELASKVRTGAHG
jgi:hypothetical protein